MGDHLLRLLRGVNIAIGEHWNVDRRYHGRDGVILNAPLEGAGPGSAVYGQGCDAGIFSNAGNGYTVFTAGRDACSNL